MKSPGLIETKMPDPKPDPKPKPKGGISWVVDIDMEDIYNIEITDFIWTEDHDPPPIVKPKKTIPDGEGEDIVREEVN